MENQFRRVAMHIDGNAAAVVELLWDPQICPECKEHHYEVVFCHGYINLKSWKYTKIAEH